MNTLNEPQFVSMMAWGVVFLVEVYADRDGWYIKINGSYWLGGKKDVPEIFPSIERAVLYLHAVGCEHLVLHLNRWPELPERRDKAV